MRPSSRPFASAALWESDIGPGRRARLLLAAVVAIANNCTRRCTQFARAAYRGTAAVNPQGTIRCVYRHSACVSFRCFRRAISIDGGGTGCSRQETRAPARSPTPDPGPDPTRRAPRLSVPRLVTSPGRGRCRRVGPTGPLDRPPGWNRRGRHRVPPCGQGWCDQPACGDRTRWVACSADSGEVGCLASPLLPTHVLWNARVLGQEGWSLPISALSKVEIVEEARRLPVPDPLIGPKGPGDLRVIAWQRAKGQSPMRADASSCRFGATPLGRTPLGAAAWNCPVGGRSEGSG